MQKLLGWMKTNHVPVGAILVFVGSMLAGDAATANKWIADHDGTLNAIAMAALFIGTLWPTKYGTGK